MTHIDEITERVIASAIDIHRSLGPGMFEMVYQRLLAHELERKGVPVQRQLLLPVEYGGLRVAEAYRIDLLVNDEVVVEVKSLEKLAPIHTQQILTYLRLSHKKMGLILNFGAPTLREGIKRVVNGYTDISSSPLRVNRPPAA